MARLATLNVAGGIDLVPFTFAAIDDGTLVSAVDHKPKTTNRLRRLDNIRAHPAVTVLVDHYDEEWGSLWWVRARGVAEVHDELAPVHAEALVEKYAQYRGRVPSGPAIVIRVTGLTGWDASG